jgi:hypothetical protein
MDSSCGKPHRVNYAPSTPLPKGIRSYFANDVVGAVHIRVDVASVRRPIQPASPRFTRLPLKVMVSASGEP